MTEGQSQAAAPEYTTMIAAGGAPAPPPTHQPQREKPRTERGRRAAAAGCSRPHSGGWRFGWPTDAPTRLDQTVCICHDDSCRERHTPACSDTGPRSDAINAPVAGKSHAGRPAPAQQAREALANSNRKTPSVSR